MPPEALQQSAAGLFILFALAAFMLATAAQARVILRILRDGGQVGTAEYRMPDGLVAIVLASSFFGFAVNAGLHRGSSGDAVKVETIIPGAFFFLLLSVGVLGFLAFRGLNLITLLGVARLRAWLVLGWASGLVLVAFVLSGAVNALTFLALDGAVERQPLVNLFHDVAQRNDVGALAQILLAGAVLAPVCEEILFRGFFYPVGKRYLGPLVSGFVGSLLFAGIHLSIPAFAGLFVLSVCLTLAYERTGSLLVPIAMHALFNLTSLVVVWCQARGYIPAS